MVPASDGADELDQRDEDAPDPARDCLGVPAEDLDGQCGRVSARGVVGDGAEGEDDDAEAAEAAEAVVACQEEGTRGNAVSFLPGRVRGHAGRNAYADDVAEYQSEPDTRPGGQESDPFGSLCRVVDVEVGAESAESDDAGKFQREERASVGGNGTRRTVGDRRRVEVLAGGADEDEDGEHLWKKGVSSFPVSHLFFLL